MKYFSSGLLQMACLSGMALAHYKWPALIIDGTITADYQYVRQNTNNINPVMDISSLDMRCNQGGLDSGSATHTAEVVAGSTVGFTLSNVISHVGPIMVYMAKSPGNPSDWDGSGNLWFKISEWGPDFSTGTINWPQLGVSQYEFTIPSAVPDGSYLLRIEQLGVYNAAMLGGAQFFFACAQVNVTGGESGTPGPLVAFPGAYSATDPGILFNTYYPQPKSYTIPGPPVWHG
ncbi:hypothetical protein VTI74DRAFT_4422 [Chaetomium olivicolor]